MTERERLGLAYNRLNSWQWDDFIGEKPEGFDSMPDWSKDDENNTNTKYHFIQPKMKEIESKIGKAACSRYWWKFVLNRGFVCWALWYYLKITVCDTFKKIRYSVLS